MGFIGLLEQLAERLARKKDDARRDSQKEQRDA